MSLIWYRTYTVDGVTRGIGYMKMSLFVGWTMGMFAGMTIGNLYTYAPVSPFVRDA